MTRQMFGTAVVAAVFGATALAGAQTQPPAGQHAGQDRDQQQQVTVIGCLQAESEIPGRDDSVWQRMGITDKDFLLLNAEVKSGTQTGTQTGATGATGAQTGTQPGTQTGTTGTTGMGALSQHMPAYKISGLDEERLRQHKGQRVQIQGQIERDHDRPGMGRTGTGTGTGTATGTGTGTKTGTGMQSEHSGDRLPELRATSIQRAEGTCPAVQ